jgi:hypothetical protein
MVEESGTAFDPACVTALQATIDSVEAARVREDERAPGADWRVRPLRPTTTGRRAA